MLIEPLPQAQLDITGGAIARRFLGVFQHGTQHNTGDDAKDRQQQCRCRLPVKDKPQDIA